MGVVSRPIATKPYDVQAGTGAPVSTVPAAQWYRGNVYRLAMPAMRLPPYWIMYDPTDPRTWAYDQRA